MNLSRLVLLLALLVAPAFHLFAARPPGVPDVTHPGTALSIVQNFAIADGSSSNVVKAHIVDEFGNPVVNQEVHFEVNGTFFSVFTNASGDAILSFSVNVAGNISVSARVNGKQIIFPNVATVVTFTPGPPSVLNNGTRLEVVATNAVANGTATNRVKAHITDANGNIVANTNVTFEIVSGTGNIVGTVVVTTDANGEAFVDIVSTVAGDVGLRASLNGLYIVNGSPAIVTFVADVPDVSAGGGTHLSVVTTNAVANGTATNSVKATVVDANGNPVANQTIEFFIVNGAGTIVGSSTVTTNAAGEAVIPLTSTVAGDVSIRAEVNGVPVVNGSPAVVTFVADVPDVSAGSGTFLSVVTTNAVANGTATNSVKATVVDANGNPVANQPVEFFIVNGTGAIVGSSIVMTDAAGEAIIPLISTVAGDVSIRAEVNGAAIVDGSPAVVTFVADTPDVSAGSGTFLSVVATNAVANGTATNSVKATVVDANGNPVANQTVEFFIVDGTGTIVGSATATTNAAGEAVIQITSTVAGDVSIRAEVNGAAIVDGSPAVVTFVADTPDLSATGNTRLSVVTTNAVANGTATNSVKATVVDANGNPVANQAVTFFIVDGTGTFLGTTTVTTNAAGEAVIQLTSTVAGQVRIRAEVGGTAIVHGSPASVIFVADTPDVSAGSGTHLSVVTTDALANGTATNSVKATVVDANGNPVPNQTVEFFIVNGTGTIVGSSTVTTDANGEATITVTSTVAGPVSMKARVNGTEIMDGSPAVVNFVWFPDPNHPATVLLVVDDNALADGAEQNRIKAHVVAPDGNVLPNKSVRFEIASGDGEIVTPQPVMTDANGDAFIQIISNTPGTVKFSARVEQEFIKNGSPAPVKFISPGIWVPKVFTPNNDGKNDLIKPIISMVLKFEYFTIYNRWGNLLFSSTNPNNGWDGRFKGVLQPNETYLWIISGEDKDGKKIKRRGMFSLVR